MIIIQVSGGLGNQMQQYAMYRKLVTLGRDVKLDLSWFTDPAAQENVLKKRELELAHFADLPMEACTAAEKKKLTGPQNRVLRKLSRMTGTSRIFEESKMYHPELLTMTDGYLVGYFACEKYYDDILPELRKLFVFPDAQTQDVQKQNDDMIAAIGREEEQNVSAVSIHIRRGDYLDNANAALFGGICTPEYYSGAAEYVARKEEEKGRSVHFYIFSDDPQYARTLHFGPESAPNTVVDINHGADSMLDIRLMSRCRDNICANSTFSFWGARLNDKKDPILVRPSVHKNTQSETPEVMHDLWKGWVLMDKQGKIF